MTYSTIIINFGNLHSSTEMVFADATKEYAIAQAVAAGYIKPEWYQFWKPRLSIFAFR
jgi:hypothetical protein